MGIPKQVPVKWGPARLDSWTLLGLSVTES